MQQIINLYIALMASLNLWVEEARKIPVGGQAVIEGVLMKGRDRWGLAIRQPNGEIFQEHWPNTSRIKRYPWKLPILRGFITMIEMLKIGFKALNRSAEIALADSEEEMTSTAFIFSIVVAIAMVIGLFIALPLWLSEYLSRAWGLSPLSRNVVEGIIRGTVFVSYVAIIGLWKDIKMVFRYHGAEHKTINAFEHNLKMSPESIATQSRIHPRCGTSFMLIVVLISIAIFSCIGGGTILWRIASRIVLLPVVVGVSYEFIRFAAQSGTLGKVLMSPVLWLQYLTTKEPDLKQLEVALTSLNIALTKE